MGSAPQSLQPQLFNSGNGSQENEAVDTAFQDDDVNHLLTGLQSMMSDEISCKMSVTTLRILRQTS